MDATSHARSELRYRRLFEAAHDGILIVDPETRQILDVNPFLTDFLGYTRADFIGKELFQIGLLEDEAASQAAFRELQTSGHIRYEDLPLETRDGRRVEVEFVSNIYQEGDRKVVQCNIRDITARKKSEHILREFKDELAQRAAALEAAVRRRTVELQLTHAQLETFVHSIAHDLRAPLRSMQGFAQLLVEEHAAGLDPQGRDYAAFINTAAQTLDFLLIDLLTAGDIRPFNDAPETEGSDLPGCNAPSGRATDARPPANEKQSNRNENGGRLMPNTEPVVLLVDDSENDAMLMRIAFKRAAWTHAPRVALDGDAAIAYLRGDGRCCDRAQFPLPAVVLLDLNMPGTNGFEVLAWIRQQPTFQRLHVYILSSSVRHEDIERSYDLGANSYLLKPGTLDELVDMARCLRAWLKTSHFASVRGLDDAREAIAAADGNHRSNGDAPGFRV